jgi:shikimate dehydrogenase
VPVAVTTQLWLLGQGVGESPSPAMQNAALRACGLDWEYSVRDVPPEKLPVALEWIRAGEVRGANVTIPHKRTVAAQCDALEPEALLTGAVNTLRMRDGELVGDNTDARGLEAALRADELWPAPGAAVVVLGAGGAAAAALLAMLRTDPELLGVAARRPELVAPLASLKPPVAPVAWDAAVVAESLRRAPHSVLINATPAGLAELPVDVAALPDGCTVVDLRYRPRPVDLVAAARARGLRACDGLEMLLRQGMLSFSLWTGLPAPIDVARAALHQAAAA